ncbi:dihydrolipoamide acetyltransferase family protein [Variovorax boronicumulans]|uniref:dihydrolipoamide acetyltransferase family protein n=1 Tax=Variovorax boronicumulans TaxID=436515 RepID=UPI00214C8A2E
MPKLGLTMTEGLVAEWSLQPGQPFTREQTVYVVETDKAANEIGAEGDGTLLEIVHPVGATVTVGEVLGYWDDGLADPASGDAAATATVAPARPPSQAASTFTPATAATDADKPHADPARERIVATPLARRKAQHAKVDLAQVAGTGPRGRIKSADVEACAQRRGGAVPAEVAQHGPQRIVPSAMQLTMARRLRAAKQEIPHFYLAREVNAGALMALRAQLNASDGRRFTLNHFFVAALGRVLLEQPESNRVWQDDHLLQLETSDVGIAVSAERGLFVPVLRDAGRLSLSELARQAHSLVERARAARLATHEMGGGAVTVSNAGMFDVTYMTPIINPGQAMILGVGSVRGVFRPDERGQPALRNEIGLVLACDHRVLDGVGGLRFLGRVAHYLEHPCDLLAGP